MQSGPYVRNEIGVGFVNNEVKMTLNQTNNQDNFELVEDVAH
jgi:hypothetical protein